MGTLGRTCRLQGTNASDRGLPGSVETWNGQGGASRQRPYFVNFLPLYVTILHMVTKITFVIALLFFSSALWTFQTQLGCSSLSLIWKSWMLIFFTFPGNLLHRATKLFRRLQRRYGPFRKLATSVSVHARSRFLT